MQFKSLFQREYEVETRFTEKGISIGLVDKKSGQAIQLPLSAEDYDDIGKFSAELAQCFYLLNNLSKQMPTQQDTGSFAREDLLSYSLDDLIQAAISYEKGRLILAYKTVAAVRFGNTEEQVGLSPQHLRLLQIPEYDLVRARLSSENNFHDRDFRLVLEVLSQYGEPLEVGERNGHSYRTKGGKVLYLVPSLHRLMKRMEEHRENIKQEHYKSNANRKKREFSEIKELAQRANIRLEEFVKEQNILYLDNLPYTIGRAVTEEVVLNPALPLNHSHLDVKFQEALSRYDSEDKPEHVNLRMDGVEGITRVVFSDAAWNQYRLVRRLQKADQSILEDLLVDPGKYIDGQLPRALLGRTFSDRVTGFIFGKLTSNRADAGSGTDWVDGLESQSTILRTTSGATIPIQYYPTPAEYEILKRSYAELESIVAKAEAERREEYEVIFTPLPPAEEQRIFIKEFDAEFNLSEIHSCCKRIEHANRVELADEEIPKAKEVIQAAEVEGRYTVVWGKNDEDQDLVIPMKSLNASIPTEKSDSGEKRVSPEIGQKASRLGVEPQWHWRRCDLIQFKSPPGFRPGFSLKDHQQRGYAWLRWLFEHQLSSEAVVPHRGALLADDMGLGKTVQVIALICHLKSLESFRARPILIVAPLSLIRTSWLKDGFRKFVNDEYFGYNPATGQFDRIKDFSSCPFKLDRTLLAQEAARVNEEMKASGKRLSECEISQDLKEQLTAIKEWCGGKVIVTSYETMRANSLALGCVDFALVVLDEAQKIKNIGVLQSNAAKALKADMCIAMTGTPIENTLMDLWGIMDFVLPGHLPLAEDFRKKYVNAAKTAQPGSSEREKLKKDLEDDLEPVWFRRTKSEIFGASGELKEIIHYDSVLAAFDADPINQHLVKMSVKQRAVYDGYVGYYNKAKQGYRLAAIRNMLEACSAPWLATGDEPTWKNSKRLFELCPKLEKTVEVLEKIRANSEADGRKVIIFANVIQIQNSLAFFIYDWNRSTSGERIEVEVYNGEALPSLREDMLSRFKFGPGFRVLIISPKAGGAGLNIEQANHVIHYTREWNPALEKQATDRAYRIGQERKVHVYYPTTSLGVEGIISAEEHLANVLRSKRDIMEDFTICPDDHSFNVEGAGLGGLGGSNENLRIASDHLALLDPESFECLVACLYEKKGYETYWVGGSGDRGVDVVCKGGDGNLLIQVKHTQNKVIQGTKGIQEVRGARSVYEKKWGMPFKMKVLTNSRFNEDAHTLAISGDQVILVELDSLMVELERHDVRFAELAKKRTQKAPVSVK